MSTVPIREIATYGVTYPTENLTFTYEDKANKFEKVLSKRKVTDTKYTVQAKRIKFEVQTTTFRSIVFEQCNFHSKGGKTIDLIQFLTFDDVDFHQSMLGTNKFFRINFKGCRFYKCDFKDAEFVDCIFAECTFVECSAYHCRFRSTEIEPQSLLDGIIFPQENFNGQAVRDTEAKKMEWDEVRLFLSNQLFTSNLSLSKSRYSDKALNSMKVYELQVTKNKLKYRNKCSTPKRSMTSALFSKDWNYVIKTWFTKLNIILTDGGTSLVKLVLLLGFATVITAIILGAGEFSYADRSLSFSSQENGVFNQIIVNLFYSISLFLTFGYTSFKSANTTGQILLTVISSFGLIWYALVIPVIVRKVYV